MASVLSSVSSLMELFVGKTQEFVDEIDDVHMVWLDEIQQEAKRMFSNDFIAEPELMPKTPSQKNSRRKRVSLGRQAENQAKRRFSKGKRSNLRGSIKSLNFIAEEDIPETSTAEVNTTTRPKRNTRKNKQTKPDVAEDATQDATQSPLGSSESQEVEKPDLVEERELDKLNLSAEAGINPEPVSTSQSPPKVICVSPAAEMPLPEAVVAISSADRLSAESIECSDGRAANKIEIADAVQRSRRSSVRRSLKLRLRHSMTQESVRRASRRSTLKRKMAHKTDSPCSSNRDEDSCRESEEEEEPVLEAGNAAVEKLKETSEVQKENPSVARITRSVAAHSPKLAPPSLYVTPNKATVVDTKRKSSQLGRKSRQSTKRKAPDYVEESPSKRLSPPKKSTIRPHMRSFLHTVQKNQILMMTPTTLGRSSVIKSFIKHTTPLKIDSKLNLGIVTKERHKLEALKKKQVQEEERIKKMEEDKKKKQDELKRKRDERLRRVVEAKVKGEEEKKKKMEQKMAQIDEKNDKRLAEERAKKKAAVKRQEELDLKKKLEEEAKRKKIQQAEEEKRQQELLAKKKAEEEEQQARKLAEARRALEVKRERERERELERELERERLAAAARERVEKEKALALQREVERAAREKERRELEERKKALEEKRKLEEQQRLAAEEEAAKEREAAKLAASGLNVTVDIGHSVPSTPVCKGAGLNVTVEIEKSPQSYVITPKGGNRALAPKTTGIEDYGMDQNSDDSTDDESAPRKAIPSWAEGHNLQQIIMKQYFNPPDFDAFFGRVEPPRLEDIFYKTKPRYNKRTSSAVWNSPPAGAK
ncbi:inner centromere protein [Brachionichthys hirsutus]|uniref:inner centromere protein n=1 Tax=Brachionichthys hirsutus TaxID=412623 RepID=UPI0036043B94